jgi:hypothetical protein
LGRLLVISGVPAAGKSSYCTWLSGQGWVAINHDRVNVSTRPIDQKWWSLVISGRAADFVQVVEAGQEDVALEFGFPLGLFPQVRLMKSAGAQHWWFDANEQTARVQFIARNERAVLERKPELFVPIQAFDNYVSDLAIYQDQIRKFFAPKIIETLKPDGIRLPVEEIHQQVLAGSTWPSSSETP